MAGTQNKVSISIPDESLLEWAKERAETQGKSLSAIFTEALRVERQMEARRALLADWPGPRATPGEMAAIRAEWAGGPRFEPGKPAKVTVERSRPREVHVHVAKKKRTPSASKAPAKAAAARRR